MPATELILSTIAAPASRELDETTMDKQELLEYLDLNEQVAAEEVANAMQMSYSATAMALMRLVRQDLAARHIDPDTQLHVYEITPKGEARLDFFLEREINDD